MEWRRRWVVRFRWEPGYSGIVERHAYTPAELRQLLDYGRSEPGIWKFTHESERYLAGERPTACRNGHPYTTGTLGTGIDWIKCECGGHHVWLCSWPGCGDRRVDPEPC